jgi:tetraprenyl-beta-curcumene synthase
MRSVAEVPHGSRARELAALVVVMARFWLMVFPLVRSELHMWRRRASAIPNPVLRAQALATLDSERLSAAGAALFAATTPRRRRAVGRALVRALVAYQVMCDYLDTLAEQPSRDPIRNGVQLHRALADAVASGPLADYYRNHELRDDGGYLAALVIACRKGCATLPAYASVRTAALREAARNEVQGINHAPAGMREPRLRAWAAAAQAGDATATGDASWFELAAAGSSSLAVLALIAAAADPATTPDAAERTRQAYFPWVEALSTLLDSVADRERDRRTGELNFLSQYPTQAAAIGRLRDVTARALAGARSLPRGERHVVLVVGMVALHVSEPGAWRPSAQPVTRAVLRAADAALMRPLLVLLRAWRGVRAAHAAYSGGGAACVTPTPMGQLTPVPPSPQ